MPNSEIRLPLEILETILNYLDTEEVVKCSVVNYSWYVTSRRVLERKFNMLLSRWPDTLPSTVQDACLAGDLSIKLNPLDKLKHLRTLKLWYDNPGLLPDNLLEQIFNSCEKLSHLEILNLSTIEKRHLECILEQCTPGLRLRISLVHSESSPYVINLLEEYQELFEEIVVEVKNSKSVTGWHPIYSTKSKFRLKNSAMSVSLTSPGLLQLECPQFCYVRTLKLEKCSSLEENVLISLSKLIYLGSFSIDCFSAKASIWISSFKTGFSALKSFSSTNNQIIPDEAIHALCDKNLETVTLDFRKGLSETSIPHLYKLQNLVCLKIFTNKVETNELLEGIQFYWNNIRTLEVEECTIGSVDSIRIVEALESFVSSKQNITFIHKINCIKFQDSIINKND